MANPNRDWAWDQFDLDINQGELDNLNDSELRDAGLTRSQQVDYETKFIDNLYGTNDAQWTGEGMPYDYGSPSGAKGALRTAERYRASYLGVDTTIWGLDLKRVDNDAFKPGTHDHYLHLTQGHVNWAHYETDVAYIAAFKKAGVDFEEGTTQQKVNWIRAANDSMGANEDKKDQRTEPAGTYDADNIYTEDIVDKTGEVVGKDLYIGGERQQTLSEKYSEGKGRLPVGFTYTRKDEDGNNVEVSVDAEGGLSKSAFDPISGPPSDVVKPNIKIPNVQVKVPDSLKQWKADAKQTLKVGGTRE